MTIARELEKIVAEFLTTELHAFIDYCIHNGAPGLGQELYDRSANPWLQSQIEEFVKRSQIK